MEDQGSSYARYLSGDDQGIVDIVTDYKDGLIMYLNSIVQNLSLAEELAEDTFFRLMIKRPRYNMRSSFKTWLYAIGRNVAIDYLRRNKYVAADTPEDLAEVLAGEEDILAAYLRNEDRRILLEAISRLSADKRQMLWLVYFEGYSGSEAGTVMGKSDRQSRNLLYRAKQALREELKKENITYEDFA